MSCETKDWKVLVDPDTLYTHVVLTLWQKEKDEREKDITSDEKNSKRKQVKTQKTIGKIKVKKPREDKKKKRKMREKRI